MRNSEPDSKHFVESLDFLSIPCQNPQKPPQNCAIYWCPRQMTWPDLTGDPIFGGHKDAQTGSMGPGASPLCKGTRQIVSEVA